MLLRLALRNIWRNKRRTLLTVSAMVVSSSLLILALGVFSGMFRDMLASATEQYHGHLVVSARGYQEDRDMFSFLQPGSALEEAIQSTKGLTGASPRLRAFGLVSHTDTSQPAELLGVLPQRERQVTSLAEKTVAGGYLPDSPANGAFMGHGLAEKLGVAPGDELVFLTQAADGSIGNDLLRVTGLFETGDAGHDNSLVLVGLPWLQQVTVMQDRLHEVALGVLEPMRAAEIALPLNTRLPEGTEALDWGQLLPEMREAIAAYDVSRFIVVIILYLATGLGILNTFFMSVMERTREFGILMAMGMRPWRIRTLVLLESLLMGGISLVLGLTLGLAMSLYMAEVGLDLSGHLTPITYAGGTILPRLSAVLEWPNFSVPAVLLFAVCLMAGFLPASRAARLNPVEAIREE
ncbi:MAG: ABC transporter permease [Desulfuromonas sp.]|uniref:ABC transporter permease n=1 Tax=Desulfuromonas sp. TaxID=892 RepID=UPI000CC06EFC|nr:FtsX-like permease family protein [Desulfuromonas sp.]PLX86542.1 MAG: ABC transporter permease [Desulfuromonas sp.]